MKKYVIIGCGNAGFKASLTIRKFDKNSEILLITDEDYPPYCRCLLSYYLEDRIDENFLFQDNLKILTQNNINFIKNCKIIDIDTKNQELYSDNNKKFKYDKLLISTGGNPVTPDFNYSLNSKVLTLRTFNDAKNIKNAFKAGDVVVFEGGGLVSLKTLLSLYEKGIKPIWIIKSPHILSFIIDSECANIIELLLTQKEIAIYTEEKIIDTIYKNEYLIVKTDKNREIKAQGIIVGKGVKTEKIDAKNNFNFNEGYIVNNFLQTNIPNVYAAGDCIICKDIAHNKKWRIPLWPLAGEQGIIAGKNMVFDNKVEYNGDIPINSFSVFNNAFITGGKKKINEDEKDDYIIEINSGKNYFKKFFYLKENKKLKGYFLMNDIKNAGTYYQLIRRQL